jgi:hypothetical protein
MKTHIALLVTLTLAVPAASMAQGPSFAGSWKLDKAEPLPNAGRGGGRGGGGAANDENAFGAVTQMVTISQSAGEVAVQDGPKKATYTLDGKQRVVPPGDVNGLKTWAHWEGPKLHLHFKQGMNWGRDVLTVNGGSLTVVRDIESGGGSTTRTIIYSKAP